MLNNIIKKIHFFLKNNKVVKIFLNFYLNIIKNNLNVVIIHNKNASRIKYKFYKGYFKGKIKCKRKFWLFFKYKVYKKYCKYKRNIRKKILLFLKRFF